jgi:hypothetical protein
MLLDTTLTLNSTFGNGISDKLLTGQITISFLLGAKLIEANLL